MAKAMHALMMPEMSATHIPLAKLNSLMAACFCSVESSFSLSMPARPHTPMPARQTRMPTKVTSPEGVVSRVMKVPSNRGGMSVPKAAQKPRATA